MLRRLAEGEKRTYVTIDNMMAGDENLNELHPEIKEALLQIDFVKRYEALSGMFDNKRTPSNERLIYIDRDEVINMIHESGYTVGFDDDEKFFKTCDEKNGPYTFRVHIILRDGAFEAVWVVYENSELLLGSPWAVYARRLISPDYRIKRPVIGTYDDLEEILKVSFNMFEDFKKALAEKQGCEHNEQTGDGGGV